MMTTEDIPDDILAALSESPTVQAAFLKMPPSHKQRWVDHIVEAKKAETRASRIAKMVERIEADNQ